MNLRFPHVRVIHSTAKEQQETRPENSRKKHENLRSMMLGPFEYFEPLTVKEAISLLRKFKGKAKVLAGGTDLIRMSKEKRLRPKFVINIGRISDLNYIQSDDNKGLRIGAIATIRDIEKSQIIKRKYNPISEAAGKLGVPAIRNMATIGGNLCNASPSADTAPPLIAFRASVRLASSKGERLVRLEDFFTGPGASALRTDELLVEIQVPAPPINTFGAYLKLGTKGNGEGSLAVVGVAVVITRDPASGNCEDVRIVLGAVAPTPIRAHEAERILQGKNVDERLLEKAAQAAADESRPISDVRGSAEYRKDMVKVLIRHAIEKVIQYR